MASGSAVKLRSFTRPRTPCGLPISPTNMRLPVTGYGPLPGLSGGRGGGGAFLRLLLRRRLLRLLREDGHRRQAGMAEELRHAVGRLRAVAQPMRDALGFQLHAVGMLARQHRVVAAHLLDEAA